ncbi:hypothetical protein [Sporosalibacterium faouarense]|uniref:hypothetical protein n=1 Tax=Sporosalibacterium faouarense TaxID=516123 RepID=UPI00141C3808|nr:hypothetical protein [Sporosalibacterium faouarense]MTI47313.1 hypothetical protein [Bacillota bacterium]
MPINEKFVITLQGKSYVTYEGLLDLAHQNQLKSIEVDLVQYPSKDNNMTAICRATAITNSNKFVDYGDASPMSVNSKIAPHIIRMASTRAKARALRDLTNIGMTAIEELNTEDISEPNETVHQEYTSTNVGLYNDEPPTQRQVDTLKKLSSTLDVEVDYRNLTKRSAGSLISRMLDEKYNRH